MMTKTMPEATAPETAASVSVGGGRHGSTKSVDVGGVQIGAP